MNLQPTTITPHQWQKVAKALYYSFASGFTGGFLLAITGAIQQGNVTILKALGTAAVVGGVVGGLNSLAVTLKQLFTPAE